MTQVTDFTTGLGYSSGLGATSAYPVAFTFTIPANTGADRTFTYKFTVNESTTDFQVKQLGASSSISFSASSANVDADGGYDGTAISVNAPEGVTWEITPNNS